MHWMPPQDPTEPQTPEQADPDQLDPEARKLIEANIASQIDPDLLRRAAEARSDS